MNRSRTEIDDERIENTQPTNHPTSLPTENVDSHTPPSNTSPVPALKRENLIEPSPRTQIDIQAVQQEHAEIQKALMASLGGFTKKKKKMRESGLNESVPLGANLWDQPSSSTLVQDKPSAVDSELQKLLGSVVADEEEGNAGENVASMEVVDEQVENASKNVKEENAVENAASIEVVDEQVENASENVTSTNIENDNQPAPNVTSTVVEKDTALVESIGHDVPSDLVDQLPDEPDGQVPEAPAEVSAQAETAQVEPAPIVGPGDCLSYEDYTFSSCPDASLLHREGREADLISQVERNFLHKYVFRVEHAGGNVLKYLNGDFGSLTFSTVRASAIAEAVAKERKSAARRRGRKNKAAKKRGWNAVYEQQPQQAPGGEQVDDDGGWNIPAHLR